MSTQVMTPDLPISQLTIGQLEAIISTIVRRVVREELSQSYYVNEDGLKVLSVAEEIAPTYLAQLEEDYAAIQEDKTELVSGEAVLSELRTLGLDV